GFLENDGGVIDQAGSGVAVIQCSAVNEGVEAGAWLAFGLGGTVVIALLERKAAYQGANGAVCRIQSNQCALRSRQLGENESVVIQALDSDNIAGLDDIGRFAWHWAHAIAVEEGPRPLHARPGDCLFFTVA